MQYFAEGSPNKVINQQEAGLLLDRIIEQLGDIRHVLLIPPDYTRVHSGAGELTVLIYERLKSKTHLQIMPALGTHNPMSEAQINKMFPGIPLDLFIPHDWRNDLVRIGEIPSRFIHRISEGKLDYSISCEINRLLVEGHWDRIISLGQLVPHEVAGIANHNKNIYVGVGGQDTINKTHFLGAVYGMERIMGREKSPVREVLNYADEWIAKDLPVSYILTVRAHDEKGKLVTRGLYAGDDVECFHQGSRLCRQVNLNLLDRPLKKVVVYLDPNEYQSTWLGNKAIYRTRMAMEDGGELIVLAPGVKEFGEDSEIDRLIRKYGYRGTAKILNLVRENADLNSNLSAAAHLIHGSSEGRFRICYCPGGLTREEIEGVGFEYADLDKMMKKYSPEKSKEGENWLSDGEKFFYVSNPGLGLWGLKSEF